MNFHLTAMIVGLLAAANGCTAAIVPLGVPALPALPALQAAPVVAAAAPVIGYTNAVPYNVPPHASRIDVNTRTLAAPPPLIAAPAPVYFPGAPLAVAPTALG